MENEEISKAELVRLTTEIAAAHVSNNSVAVGDLPNLIANLHGALAGLVAFDAADEKPVPIVSVRASVKPDFIICLVCGKKQKTLRRHLNTHHHLMPDEYREQYDLPADYPMVAPNYSEQRRKMAKDLGLGKRGAAGRAAAAMRRGKRAANG